VTPATAVERLERAVLVRVAHGTAGFVSSLHVRVAAPPPRFQVMFALVLVVPLAGPEIADTTGFRGTTFHASLSAAVATAFVTRTSNVWSAPLTPGTATV